MPLIDLSMVNGVWTLKLSMIQTVGLAIITLFIGTWINKHAKILQKLCIPAPAIGALPFAFINAFLAYFKIINITFDSQLQSPQKRWYRHPRILYSLLHLDCSTKWGWYYYS